MVTETVFTLPGVGKFIIDAVLRRDYLVVQMGLLVLTVGVMLSNFIVAVRGLGARSGRIILKHLLPNCLAPVIVQASLAIAAAILLEAALSFLGVGVKPPTPTWGGMLRHAFETVSQAPWLTVSPGVVIFLVVLAFNFFGDALRDVLDPKLRGTR